MSKKSYDKGYKIGRNWKDDYVPGGPFFCDEESKAENNAWKEGFFDGLEVCRYKETENIQKLLKEI